MENIENTEFVVILKGGSIGERKVSSRAQLRGTDIEEGTTIYFTKEDAKISAKDNNKYLSPSEKKYYGLRYIVCEIKDRKYTGK
jgi:hypothetical protein